MAKAEIKFGELGGNNTAGHYGGSFTPSTSAYTALTCDFAPTKVILWQAYGNSDMDVIEYDVAEGKAYEWYKNSSQRNPSASLTSFFSVAADGTVSVKPSGTNAAQWVQQTWWVAIKE